MSAHEWDAAAYDRVSDVQARWGTGVLDRLDVVDGGTVLDVGTGSGRVAEQLLQRRPDVHVVALDASQAMLDQAAQRLAPYAPRVRFVRADLNAPPELAPVDAILTTATLHWVPDHDTVFAAFARWLHPGGPFVGQWGGEGNIARVCAVLDELGAGWRHLVHFDGVDDTRARLVQAGFDVQDVWLAPEPTRFESRDVLRDFLRTVVLSGHAPHMEPNALDRLADAVMDRLDDLTLDYVRLNVVASRR